MTDVRLYQAENGGEIDIVNGQTAMDDTIETAVYLSLFGGNNDDGGGDADKPKEWWGNKIERVQERKMRSELQSVLHGLPLVPANLRIIEDAASADLAWMTETALATFVSATATMPGARNTVKLAIKAEIQGQPFSRNYTLTGNQQ
jgi:phage gp46-like protein